MRAFTSPLSSTEDAARAAQRARTKTPVAVRRSLSTHFDTHGAHGQSQSVRIASRLAQDRSDYTDFQSGFADFCSRGALDRSGSADFPSHGTRVPSRCARGRSGSALDRSQDPHGRSLCATVRSRFAGIRSEDTQRQSGQRAVTITTLAVVIAALRRRVVEHAVAGLHAPAASCRPAPPAVAPPPGRSGASSGLQML